MREIRDERLYRETHASFEAYLDDRWSLARARAYRLIDAARVIAVLSPTGDIPSNERQARELVPLLEDELSLIATWREACAKYGDRITAEKVRAAVETLTLGPAKALARERSDERRAFRQADDAAASPGSAEFHQADFRQAITMLANRSVELLLTDPPYGLGYRAKPYYFAPGQIHGDESEAAAAELLDEALTAFQPKLAPTAHVLVFCSARNEAATRSLIEAHGLTVRSFPVWVKDGHGVGDTLHSFGPAHERIVHATIGDARMRYRESDVLSVPRVRPHIHPTQKPLELLERLIRATTNPGDLVADPFAGVASTLVAAVRTGRRGWGCEIDADYHATGVARLRALADEDTGAEVA